MENDPDVRAGLLVRELAILAKPPAFNFKPSNAEDEAEAEQGRKMVAFLEYVYGRLKPSPYAFLRNLLAARKHGFSVIEKVWASEKNEGGEPSLKRLTHPEFMGFVWIEKVKHLPPESIAKNGLETDEFGNLRAVVQNYTPVTTLSKANLPDVALSQSPNKYGQIEFTGKDLERLIVHTANSESGNPYGRSDLLTAYTPWYSKMAALHARDVLLERSSGIVVADSVNPSENETLKGALETLGPGSTLVVAPGSNPRFLVGWEGAVKGFNEAADYNGHQILRALLVPNLAIGGGSGDTGSFARADSDFDTLMAMCRSMQLELEITVERDFVEPLIRANFGDVLNYPTFDFPELQEKDRAVLATIWSAAIRDGYVDPMTDHAWLRREMGVPEDAGDFTPKPKMRLGPDGLPIEDPNATPDDDKTPESEAKKPAEDDAPPKKPDEDEEDDAEPAEVRAAAAEKLAAVVEALTEPTPAEPPPEPPAGPRVEIERVETPAMLSFALSHLEDRTRASLGAAAMKVLQDAIHDVPAELDDVDRIKVPAAALQKAMDAASEDILKFAFDDFANKLEAIGKTAEAEKVRRALRG